MNPIIVGIILARGGSKGIPNKNLQEIGGIPLIAHSIRVAKKSDYIDEVYVSTDSTQIKEVSTKYGAKVIDRPPQLATDTSSSEAALLHAAEILEFDILVFIQCTSPLTLAEDYDNALSEFQNQGYDSMLSVTKDHGGFLCGGFTWEEGGRSINYDYTNRPRRQDMKNTYRENGAFYITTKSALLKSKNRISGIIGFHVMPYTRSFEIDEKIDLQFIRSIYPIFGKLWNMDIKRKISKLRMILFDVDGCFTDGSVYLDQEGREMLKFSRIDGKGIELLRNAGYICGVISSEQTDIVRRRMEKLGMNEIRLGISNKIEEVDSIRENYGFSWDQIAFCGDDIQDIDVMQTVGLGFAPSNAQDSVKSIADYTSNYRGGEGFIRDVVNIILTD